MEIEMKQMKEMKRNEIDEKWKQMYSKKEK